MRLVMIFFISMLFLVIHIDPKNLFQKQLMEKMLN